MSRIYEIPSVQILILTTSKEQTEACKNTWAIDTGQVVKFFNSCLELISFFTGSSTGSVVESDFYFLADDTQYIVVNNLVDYLTEITNPKIPSGLKGIANPGDNRKGVFITTTHSDLPDPSGIILSKDLLELFLSKAQNVAITAEIMPLVKSVLQNVLNIKCDRIRPCNMFGTKKYDVEKRCCKFCDWDADFERMQKINYIISCGYMNPELMNEYYLYWRQKENDQKEQDALEKLLLSGNPSNAPQSSISVDPSWTFVTALFDLSKYEKNPEKRTFNKINQYLQWARFVMTLKVNLVVYCNPEHVAFFTGQRQMLGLEKFTKIIPINIEDSYFYQFRQKISRRKNIYNYTVSDTAVYDRDYSDLLTIVYCSKFHCMEEALKWKYFEEPFKGSSNNFSKEEIKEESGAHFYGWIDIGIYKTEGILPHQLYRNMKLYREKCSFCYIDFTSRAVTENLPLYYEYGRCNSASGFFTGERSYMTQLVKLFKEKFQEHLGAGYLRAEEQIIHPIHLQHPEIFENYYGDYNSIVCNYDKIRKDVPSTIRFYIARTRECAEHNLCINACLAILNSYSADPPGCQISLDNRLQLYSELFICAFYRDKTIALQAMKGMENLSSEKGFGELFASRAGFLISNTNYLYPSKPLNGLAGGVVKINYKKKHSIESILADDLVKFLALRYKLVIYADIPLTYMALCHRDIVLLPNGQPFPEQNYVQVINFE